MSKEFVPYEEALALKELGCVVKPFKEYDTLGILQQVGLLESHQLESIPAPLYQQAFRWFREKYKLFGEINLTTKQENVEVFEFFVLDINEPLFESDDYAIYEEVELACLRKLIETKKTKQ